MRQLHVRGNATVEAIVSLLALSPFLIGIPLLGKQLDLKHKAYDSARYSVWERTVWSNAGSANRKSDADISLESRDRTLGDPRSGVLAVENLRERGLGENPIWRDAENRRIVRHADGANTTRLDMNERPPSINVGRWIAAGVAHGGGPVERIAETLQLRHLGLNSHGLASASTAIVLRPLLIQAAQQRVSLDILVEEEPEAEQIVQRAEGAILSDAWSARDENVLGRRVDDVTTNELIDELERPGRVMGIQARGKGQPLYGEGQYGWDPDLRPRSTVVPSSYVRRQ